jgi:hypothetical protein
MPEAIRYELTILAGKSRTNAVNLNRSTPRRIHTDPATEGGRLLVLHGMTQTGSFGPATRSSPVVKTFDPGGAIELGADEFPTCSWVRLQIVTDDNRTAVPQSHACTFSIVAVRE